MQEAAYFGTEIILMRSGRIVQIGNFTDLTEHPAEDFVKEFIKLHQFPLAEEAKVSP